MSPAADTQFLPSYRLRQAVSSAAPARQDATQQQGIIKTAATFESYTPAERVMAMRRAVVYSPETEARDPLPMTQSFASNAGPPAVSPRLMASPRVHRGSMSGCYPPPLVAVEHTPSSARRSMVTRLASAPASAPGSVRLAPFAAPLPACAMSRAMSPGIQGTPMRCQSPNLRSPPVPLGMPSGAVRCLSPTPAPPVVIQSAPLRSWSPAPGSSALTVTVAANRLRSLSPTQRSPPLSVAMPSGAVRALSPERVSVKTPLAPAPPPAVQSVSTSAGSPPPPVAAQARRDVVPTVRFRSDTSLVSGGGPVLRRSLSPQTMPVPELQPVRLTELQPAPVKELEPAALRQPLPLRELQPVPLSELPTEDSNLAKKPPASWCPQPQHWRPPTEAVLWPGSSAAVQPPTSMQLPYQAGRRQSDASAAGGPPPSVGRLSTLPMSSEGSFRVACTPEWPEPNIFSPRSDPTESPAPAKGLVRTPVTLDPNFDSPRGSICPEGTMDSVPSLPRMASMLTLHPEATANGKSGGGGAITFAFGDTSGVKVNSPASENCQPSAIHGCGPAATITWPPPCLSHTGSATSSVAMSSFAARAAAGHTVCSLPSPAQIARLAAGAAVRSPPGSVHTSAPQRSQEAGSLPFTMPQSAVGQRDLLGYQAGGMPLQSSPRLLSQDNKLGLARGRLPLRTSLSPDVLGRYENGVEDQLSGPNVVRRRRSPSPGSLSQDTMRTDTTRRTYASAISARSSLPARGGAALSRDSSQGRRAVELQKKPGLDAVWFTGFSGAEPAGFSGSAMMGRPGMRLSSPRTAR
eukprot:TRINITY_DN25196_c0_g1_i1.p1 TRINITY_DN25196_c0_g1~~TRINITY_DN25196_c0_g1_i1.p1  ORF type:complete len:803 (+),score=91.44 TRINITY_DN25196_c0_g1_i1:126-2534(+)